MRRRPEDWRLLQIAECELSIRKRPEGGIEVRGMDLAAEHAAQTLAGADNLGVEAAVLLDAIYRERPQLELRDMCADELMLRLEADARGSRDPIRLAFSALLGGEYVRRGVAQNQQTPSPVLRWMALLRPELVARNPSLAPELRRRLLTHPDLEVRSAVAHNPALCQEELVELLLDPAFEVRYQVLTNQRMTARLAEPYVRGLDSVHRFSLVQHAWNSEVAELLLHDPSQQVRMELALRDDLSEGAAKVLLQDPLEEVSERARLRLAELRWLAEASL